MKHVRAIKQLPQSVVSHLNFAFPCHSYSCTAAYTVVGFFFFLPKRFVAHQRLPLTQLRFGSKPRLHGSSVRMKICESTETSAFQMSRASTSSCHEPQKNMKVVSNQQEPLELEQSICVEHFKQRFSQHSSS